MNTMLANAGASSPAPVVPAGTAAEPQAIAANTLVGALVSLLDAGQDHRLEGFAGVAAQAQLNVPAPVLVATEAVLPESVELDALRPQDGAETVDDAPPDVMALLASFAPVWLPPRAESKTALQPGGRPSATEGNDMVAALSQVHEERGVAVPVSGAVPVLPVPAAAVHAAPVRLPVDGAAATTAAVVAPGVVALPALSVQDSGAGMGIASRTAAVAVPVAAHSAQPLMQALSQRIQLQQVQGVEVATVRLDPPQWGTVEVRIQHEAGGVQVFIQASHAEVGRQLAGMAENLRQELQARSGGEATVVVAQGRQSGGAAGQGSGARDGAQFAAMADEDDEIGQALQAWQPPA